MRLPRLLVYLWAFPTTAIGVCVAAPALVTRGTARWVDGVLEIHGGFVSTFLADFTLLGRGAEAMTLGHIVLGRTQDSLEWTRTHERVHVRQCERWGPLFLPAYGVASLIAWWRGGNLYFDNAFEREAYAVG